MPFSDGNFDRYVRQYDGGIPSSRVQAGFLANVQKSPVAPDWFEELQGPKRECTCTSRPTEKRAAEAEEFGIYCERILKEGLLDSSYRKRFFLGVWPTYHAFPSGEHRVRRPGGLWLPDDDRRYGRPCDGCSEIRDALAKTSLQIAELVEQVRELVEQVRELGKRVGRLEAGIK